jgi:hypothetical protein
MIRTSILTVLLTTVALASSVDAAPRGKGGLSVSFNRHGGNELSLQWTSGHRRKGREYGRSASVIRPRYEASGGRYEWRTERVWVPASRQKVWTEPVVRVHYDSCGRRVETVVRAGRWEIVHTPGHYEERRARVWVSTPVVCRY